MHYILPFHQCNTICLQSTETSPMICVAGGNGFRGGNRSSFRGGKRHLSIPNAHVRSEIKDLDQVRKERQKKADRVSHMKSKSKGKKFGKNGKKRKSK